MKSNKKPTLEQVVIWAKEAGRIAYDGFLKEHKVGYKGATDLVTEIDHQCEKAILGAIRKNFPGHSILAEESGAVNAGSEDCWYVDPLDGTINYAHQIPLYVISIAYAHAGQVQLGVVYDPSHGECFCAERGQGAWLNGEELHINDISDVEKSLFATAFARNEGDLYDRNMRYFAHLSKYSLGVRRMGSAAAELCYVACGRVNGYWELAINAWDMAAASLIVEEAGALVTTPEGDPDYFKPPYSVLATAPGIHRELRGIFSRLN